MHSFQKCGQCPDTEGDTAFNSHISEMHDSKVCPECRLSVVKTELDRHLVSKYSHKQNCELVEPNQDVLEEYVDLDHRLRLCLVCQQPQPHDQLDAHLRTQHAWFKCLFCEEVDEEDNIRAHILMTHNATESCEECSELQTSDGLPYHLRERHSWERCLYCTEVFPPGSVRWQEHIDSHKPQECAHCHDFVPIDKLTEHIFGAHSRYCPVCTVPATNMLDHLQHYKPESMPPSRRTNESFEPVPNTETS